MKKRNILVVCSFLLVCVLVFLLGLLLRSYKAEQSISSIVETNEEVDGDVRNSESTDDVVEYLEKQERDIETVKNSGNMFEQGEYQSYGGFGYKVLNFKLYDSYDTIRQKQDYGIENEVTSSDKLSPLAQFVYIELQVTNESEKDAIYYHPVDMVITQDGKTSVYTKNDQWGWAGGIVYIGGDIRSASEVDKTIQSPFTALLSAGETITLQYYYELYAVSENGEEASVEDVFTDAEYLLQVSGIMTSGEIVEEPEKDGAHIYFRCREERKEMAD